MTKEQITKLISRYIAKILSEQEFSTSYEHKNIFKKQMRFLQQDLIDSCGARDEFNRRD